jgi:type II secretion system protein N
VNDVTKERIKKFAPWIGFPIFYLFSLVLFASWTFPYDKLKERAILSYNQWQRDSGGNQELKIDELSSYRLTGADARGVRLVSAPTEPGKAPSEIKIDRIRARLSILPIILWNFNYSATAEAFGGTIDATYEDHGKERRVWAEVEDVDMGQADPIKDLIGVPVEGKLTGDVKLTLPESKLSKANGSVTIEATDVAVGDGKAKLGGKLALPRLHVGGLTINGDVKEGVLRLSKVGAGGKDLELQGDGRIQLREAVGDSLCDVNVRFKINDNYRSKNDITKSLFGAPGSTMPALFDLDPKVKQSKRQDGFYGWHLRGALGKLDYDPAPFASGAGGGGGGSGAKFPP